jgi:hypothetical protein
MLPASLVPRRRRQRSEGELVLGLGLLGRLVQRALLEAPVHEAPYPPGNLLADACDVLVGRGERRRISCSACTRSSRRRKRQSASIRLSTAL